MKKETTSKEIKSGTQIISDFFENLNKIEGVDSKITELFYNLYVANKFTDTNIKNGLTGLREKK